MPGLEERRVASLTDEFRALREGRPDLREDPYALYDRLRSEAPVFRYVDQVVLTRYADVSAVHLDAARFATGNAGMKSSRMTAFLASLPGDQRAKVEAIYAHKERWLTRTNGEQHDRLRALAHKAFTPRIVSRFEQRIRDLADDLLARVVPSGQMELVSDFGWILPMRIICDMLGVPPEDQDDIRTWSMWFASFDDGANAGAVDRAHEAIVNFERYLRDLFEQRRKHPEDDLTGALLAAQLEDGDRFSDDDLVPMVTVLLFAGHETTTNLISNGLFAMLRGFPDQWKLLVEDPALAGKATEETLRYDTSAQTAGRTAVVATEIDGVPIEQWETVTPMIGAANRDPEAYDEPNRFDMLREGPKHLAFSVGPHYCLGAALARLEVSTTFEIFASRFPELRIVGEPIRAKGHRLRGFDEFRLVLGRDHG